MTTFMLSGFRSTLQLPIEVVPVLGPMASAKARGRCLWRKGLHVNSRIENTHTTPIEVLTTFANPSIPIENGRRWWIVEIFRWGLPFASMQKERLGWANLNMCLGLPV